MSDVEHLFVYLLAVCMSSFEKYLLRSFADISIRLFAFLLLSCMHSLFKIKNNHLSWHHFRLQRSLHFSTPFSVTALSSTLFLPLSLEFPAVRLVGVASNLHSINFKGPFSVLTLPDLSAAFANTDHSLSSTVRHVSSSVTHSPHSTNCLPAPDCWWLLLLCPCILLLSPPLTQLQARWPPCDSSPMSGAFQGLCTCCSFCHRCSALWHLPGSPPFSSFKYWLKCPQHSLCPLPAPFLHSTSHHLAYYFMYLFPLLSVSTH